MVHTSRLYQSDNNNVRKMNPPTEKNDTEEQSEYHSNGNVAHCASTLNKIFKCLTGKPNAMAPRLFTSTRRYSSQAAEQKFTFISELASCDSRVPRASLGPCINDIYLLHRSTAGNDLTECINFLKPDTDKFRKINLGPLAFDDVQQVINFIYTGGLVLTTDNVINITKVAKSLKIKVLEDICVSYIMKSIEPVKSELFAVSEDSNRERSRSLDDKVPGRPKNLHPPPPPLQPAPKRSLKRPSPVEHHHHLRTKQPSPNEVLTTPLRKAFGSPLATVTVTQHGSIHTQLQQRTSPSTRTGYVDHQCPPTLRPAPTLNPASVQRVVSNPSDVRHTKEYRMLYPPPTQPSHHLGGQLYMNNQ